MASPGREEMFHKGRPYLRAVGWGRVRNGGGRVPDLNQAPRSITERRQRQQIGPMVQPAA